MLNTRTARVFHLRLRRSRQPHGVHRDDHPDRGTAYTYDAANRLTWVNDVEHTYDNRGNLTHDGVYTYTWNAAGRLVQAQSMTHTLVYTYNGDGVRVASAADGTETRYVQDVVGLPQVLVETAGEGNNESTCTAFRGWLRCRAMTPVVPG